MTFKGWQKTSLVEYPNRISTVLFCGGCNLRCPFCYNTDLVLRPSSIPDLHSKDVLAELEAERTLREAVVVTGGEPTLQEELPTFFRCVKELGYLAGLETNGTRPGKLEALLREGVLDFVAMDVKAPLDAPRYAAACGVKDEELVRGVRQSIRIILESDVEYELRTTVVPEVHKPEDILTLGKQIRGARRYVIQQFVPEKTLDSRLQGSQAFSRESLEELRQSIAPWVDACEVRNA